MVYSKKVVRVLGSCKLWQIHPSFEVDVFNSSSSFFLSHPFTFLFLSSSHPALCIFILQQFIPPVPYFLLKLLCCIKEWISFFTRTHNLLDLIHRGSKFFSPSLYSISSSFPRNFLLHLTLFFHSLSHPRFFLSSISFPTTFFCLPQLLPLSFTISIFHDKSQDMKNQESYTQRQDTHLGIPCAHLYFTYHFLHLFLSLSNSSRSREYLKPDRKLCFTKVKRKNKGNGIKDGEGIKLEGEWGENRAQLSNPLSSPLSFVST